MTQPLFVGPHNALAVLGLPWKRVQRQARVLGVRPVRVGRSHLYRADEILEAFTAAGRIEADPNPCEVELDPVEAARQALGKARRPGGEG